MISIYKLPPPVRIHNPRTGIYKLSSLTFFTLVYLYKLLDKAEIIKRIFSNKKISNKLSSYNFNIFNINPYIKFLFFTTTTNCIAL